ncbi:hypothetical protein LOK49_LG01G04037 [Camellia lanceoleosa]|uniref:Uncharacterized protein n=1 Tax=Camellia lanceoleosa TaxID=1840588 RepID=A0ACC0J6P3_9ERIC|nr:hypothetical protein LOK49_LG01G04037 [Camellia lanceoleosa]
MEMQTMMNNAISNPNRSLQHSSVSNDSTSVQSLFSLSTPSSPPSSLSSCSVKLVETRQKDLVQVLSLHFEPLLVQNENRSHWPKGRDAEELSSTVEVPCNSLSVGDQIVILPGDCVPGDGIVRDGRSAVDESGFTGEPLPVTKLPGKSSNTIT